jgi:hypothetical protein
MAVAVEVAVVIAVEVAVVIAVEVEVAVVIAVEVVIAVVIAVEVEVAVASRYAKALALASQSRQEKKKGFSPWGMPSSHPPHKLGYPSMSRIHRAKRRQVNR